MRAEEAATMVLVSQIAVTRMESELVSSKSYNWPKQLLTEWLQVNKTWKHLQNERKRFVQQAILRQMQQRYENVVPNVNTMRRWSFNVWDIQAPTAVLRIHNEVNKYDVKCSGLSSVLSVKKEIRRFLLNLTTVLTKCAEAESQIPSITPMLKRSPLLFYWHCSNGNVVVVEKWSFQACTNE